MSIDFFLEPEFLEDLQQLPPLTQEFPMAYDPADELFSSQAIDTDTKEVTDIVFGLVFLPNFPFEMIGTIILILGNLFRREFD